jgi:plasmid stability protein
MVKVIIEDVDPAVIERLEAVAKEHGRSLQAELKHILEAAAQTQTGRLPAAMDVAIKKAELMRQQIASHTGFGSTEVLEADREQALSTAIERLRKLKQTISPGEISIREMIEEGRRY